MKINISRDVPEIFHPFLKASRYKVAEGGRGGGKSHFFAEELVLQVFMYGKLALCCREVQKSLKDSVKALIENKIVKLGLSEYFSITQGEIKCYNGGKIVFAGLRNQGNAASSAENLKSFEGADICWVEEAQTVSKFSLDILLPTIRKPGSEIWFSYNRKSIGEPVHARFVEADMIPAGTIHIYVNYYDNPFLPDEMRLLMEADKHNDKDDYDHIWLGHPRKRSEASIFSNWRVREFDEDPEAMLCQGMDFGFSPDPATFIRGWIDWDRMRVCISYAEFGSELTPDKLPGLIERVPGAKRGKILADAARNDLIVYLQGKGFRIEGAEKPPGSIEAGIDWLRMFEIWIHPRCCNYLGEDYEFCLEYEMNNYARKVDPKTDEVLPLVIDKHNHAIDAIRYAFSRWILKTGSLDYVRMMSHGSGRKEFDQQKEVAERQAKGKSKATIQIETARKMIQRAVSGHGKAPMPKKELPTISGGVTLPGSVTGILL